MDQRFERQFLVDLVSRIEQLTTDFHQMVQSKPERLWPHSCHTFSGRRQTTVGGLIAKLSQQLLSASPPNIYGIEKPNRLCKDIAGFQTGFFLKVCKFWSELGLIRMNELANLSIGESLGEIGLASINSFLHHGNPFILYSDVPIRNASTGIELCDASEILPTERTSGRVPAGSVLAQMLHEDAKYKSITD